MPCDHKFQSYLDLTKIDFEPTTLIVGTFNPAWPASNTSEWFYGKPVNNCFWDVLPRLYSTTSLINATQVEWKQFCHDKQIAFTDLINTIDDAEHANVEHAKALAGFSDRAIEYRFEDFSFVNIVQLLQRQPTIRNVYFTRGITEAFWRHLWSPIMQYCNQHQLHERRLVPCSDDVSYQHASYNDQHPENQVARLEDYILMRWREEWHF